MRNNHDKKTHKLGKRTFALCLALAVICSCLLPVFATGNSDAAVMLPEDGGGIAMPVAGDDSGAVVQPGGGEIAMPVIPGDGEGTASSGSESTGTPVTDPSSVAGVTFPEGATNIVKNPNGSYSYDTAYGRITVFPDADKVDTSDVVVKPNPNLKQDDAAFGVLPIEYHFWLKKMDSFDLDDLAWEAEMANLSETGYLNLYGSSKKFPIWHMDTISADDVMGNYTFNNPTSLNDPEGKGREFAGWYTVDSTGLRHEFDPYQSYGSETNTVVNVFAAWKDASGDVVDDTKKDEETKEEDTKKEETKEKSEFDKWFDELVSCSDDDFPTLFEKYTQNEEFCNYLDALSETKVASLKARMGLLATTLKTKAYYTVKKGNSTVIYGNGSKNHAWTIVSGSDIVEFSGATNQFYVTVKGLKAGTATLKHTYQYKEWDWDQWQYVWKDGSDTITVEVQRTLTKAAVYILKNPAYKPELNDSKWWAPGAEQSSMEAYIDLSEAKTWVDGDKTKQNCFNATELDNAVVTWPDGATSGSVWKLTTTDTYFATIRDLIWDQYTSYLSQKLNIPVDQLDKKDVEEITVTAHKISRDNGGTYPYHLDCTIDIKMKKAYTAKFWVWNDTTKTYDLIDADTYAEGALVQNTLMIGNGSNGTTKQTKTINGIQYELDGWYLENASGGPYNADKKLPLTGTWENGGYAPTEQELKDGTVNFYAVYKPKYQNITITKQVTGLLGDHHKKFDFVVTVTDANGKKIDGVYAMNGKGTSASGTADLTGFQLGDNESITIYNVPVGAVVTVTEKAPGAHYEVSATNYRGTQNGANDAVFTYTVTAGASANTLALVSNDEAITAQAATDSTVNIVGGNEIIVTNDGNVDVDSGVLLDTLPYIVILAVVVGGGVMLFLRKRRKDDED